MTSRTNDFLARRGHSVGAGVSLKRKGIFWSAAQRIEGGRRLKWFPGSRTDLTFDCDTQRILGNGYPGRLVMLCNKAQILRRSDQPGSIPV